MNKPIKQLITFVLTFTIILSSLGSSLLTNVLATSDEITYLSSDEGKALEGEILVGYANLRYDENLNQDGKITINVSDGSGGYTATQFDRGLVAHAAATLNYNIENQGFTKFRAYLGIDTVTSGDNDSNVIYNIYLDNKRVYSSGAQTRFTAADYVDLDVSGAKTIKIYIDPNGVNNGDHACLADAMFVKEGTDGKRTITSVDSPASINLNYAESIKNQALPTKVTAHLSDNSTADLDVIWFADGFSSFTSGSQTIYGLLKGTDSIVNESGIIAELPVNVAEQDENTTYLSDLTPTAERYDWASKWLDAAVENKTWTLMLDGIQTYMGKGVSANSNAEISYTIPDGAETFESYVGVTADASGYCSFAVYLDGEDATPEDIAGVIYDRTVNAGKINLDVTGKSTIQIRFVTSSGYSNNGANGTFADAKFTMLNDPRADYTAVNGAIDTVNALDSSLYTFTSYKAVTDAVDAVVTGKYATQQAEVNAMAEAIQTAIGNLQLKKPFALSSEWSFLNEDATRYEFDAANQVTLMATTGELWDSPRKYTNMLLSDVGSDDFTITTKLSFSPNTDYQSAGLMVYSSDNALFSVQRRYHSGHGNNCIGGVNVNNGSPSENGIPDPSVGSDIYLKITKTGSNLEGFYSLDNENWTSVWSVSNSGLSGSVKVGLFTGKGGSSSAAEIPAVFSDFTLNSSVINFADCTDPDVNALVSDIDAIGTVTPDSGSAISEAESAYEGLSASQKELVTNYQTLVDARTEYNRITAPADYSAVTEAITNIPNDLDTAYTPETTQAVHAAVDAVDYSKIVWEQSIVDGYANAINAAVGALVEKTIEMNIGISDGMVTDSTSISGRYNITWNATITTGASTSVETINAADVKFLSYGVYYATSEAELQSFLDGTATTEARQKVFDSGEDITVYTMYGFRLKNVPENKIRTAMFYLQYEYMGNVYAVISPANTATTPVN